MENDNLLFSRLRSLRSRKRIIKKDVEKQIRKRYNVYYEFIEPWRFILQVKPYMITHYKPLNSELEKEYAELESYLNQGKIKGIIQTTINGKSYSWRVNTKHILSKVENTFTTKKCPQQSLQIILWTNESNKCLKQKQWEI
ncbi:hypothetical protein QFZ37_000786 [Chryseobacterium ginsenosidimutans]|uniref:hypothetical protein n=1 Tax=Chryseobacterium ginsenosidimutans TaxID=687846 RepID=UPI002788B3A5|nr:hypothetical protein [Chryseobacterium ginsenosidimutans]MDQ0592417.1 hypothetical protein [Chryseobacterium ginsenosidimutans]